MRLHLDTSNSAGAAETTAAAAQKSTGLNTQGNGTSSVSSSSGRDSVAVSSASSAWSASFADRSARVAQLASAVQNGTYTVSSAAVSQSIVASATA